MSLNFYTGLLFIAWTIFNIGCSIEQKAPPSQSLAPFKNVLLIISDDLATHAVGSYGNEIIRTPNIDKLSENGVRFARAYANSPMCTPSRATILTGLYPHATGVTLLRTALPDSTITIAEILQSEGFATGIFGKTHFNSKLKHGFDTLVNNQHHGGYLENIVQSPLSDSIKVRPKWKPFRDHARVWLNSEGATSGNHFEHSQGTFFANSAIDFMTTHQHDRLFVVASFREPHSPFNFSVEFQGKHTASNIVLPTSSNEDERWVPEVFNDLTDEEKKGITKSYYNSVEYMDQNVGLLLEALQRLGLSENTLVVFVGDHGYLLNHHGRFEKHMMWEESVTTPLIIKGYREGVLIKNPVELADLTPTMLAALEIKPPQSMHGKQLQGLLTGTKNAHREYIFSEYLTDNKAMITDGVWKYIFSTGKRDLGSGYATGMGAPGVTHRLYNIQLDPDESSNLGDLPQYSEELVRLQEALLRKFRQTHPAAALISNEASFESQLVQFCEPPEGEDIGSF